MNGPLRVLFVTPIEDGSGETITAMHMAQNIEEEGGEAFFLSSPYASKFLTDKFNGKLQVFSRDLDENVALWRSTVAHLDPQAIVFADYPLLFFSFGVSPLVEHSEWDSDLASTRCCLITLDHTGFAQHACTVYFGPPHLNNRCESFPAIPQRMKIMLPCPMHEPRPLGWRKGTPFRYWDLPLGVSEDRRREIRRRYVDADGILLFHSVPTWSWKAAEGFEIPYFSYLPELIGYYVRGTGSPVTLLSVNNGRLLPQPEGPLNVLNLGPMATTDYEDLMFSSDLMITENKISISMGKAICGLHPCATLKNSYELLDLLDTVDATLREIVLRSERMTMGSIYPYEVFPSGLVEELRDLRLYLDNSLVEGFVELEVFGGEATRSCLHRLLSDPAERELLKSKQAAYVRAVETLEDAHAVIVRLVDEE